MTVCVGTHIMAIRSSVSTKKYYKLFFMSVNKDLLSSAYTAEIFSLALPYFNSEKWVSFSLFLKKTNYWHNM